MSCQSSGKKQNIW